MHADLTNVTDGGTVALDKEPSLPNIAPHPEQQPAMAEIPVPVLAWLVGALGSIGRRPLTMDTPGCPEVFITLRNTLANAPKE